MNLKRLTILESKYNYAGWHVDTRHDRNKMYSSINLLRDRRDIDIYHTCGTYLKAGVPYETVDVHYDEQSGIPPHIGLTRSYSDLTCEAVREGNGVLITGGYCVFAPAIVGGMQRAIGEEKKIGVIWMDAHADNVILETTERDSVTLVGIPLSTLVGQTAKEWRINACGLNKPLRGSHILAGDCRMVNEEMQKNLDDAGIHLLGAKDFCNRAIWKRAVMELAAKVDAIYLQVDMDILEHRYIPNYFYEYIPGGHDMATVQNNVVEVMNTGKVLAFSILCANFDKDPEGQEINMLSEMKIMGKGLEVWKEIPDLFLLHSQAASL